MFQCDRCGWEYDELTCTGCAAPAHVSSGYCDDDDEGLGSVCGRCWAILSHVENAIGCASQCSCAQDYPGVMAAIEA